MFRKCAAPAVGEIKGRHVEHEQPVVSACAPPKDLAQPAPEIVFGLFGFHSVNSLRRSLDTAPLLTTKQWQDFSVPLSREERRVAR
jgi:hypothetical protein